MTIKDYILDKYVIGGVMFIALISSLGYLSPYFFDSVYDGKPVLVERIGDYHALIPNDYTDYTRYSLDNDWFKVYAGKSYILQNRYRPCYWKTYGMDEWVCPDRKVRSIKTSYTVENELITFYRDTEYYAYASHSGTAGVLSEIYRLSNGLYKQEVIWTPTNLKRNYKILYEIQLDKDITQSIDFENQLSLNHKDIPVLVNYNDIAGQLIGKNYAIDKLVYHIDCGQGECVIDPSISIANAHHTLGLNKLPKWDTSLTNWSFRTGIRITDNDTIGQGVVANVTLDLIDIANRAGMFPHIPIDSDTVLAMDFENYNSTHTYDESNNNNDGEITGATRVSNTNCQQGKCYSFDGVNDKITIADDDTLNVTQLSISVWIKLNEIASTHQILDKQYTDNTSYQLFIYTDNTIRFVYGNGSATDNLFSNVNTTNETSVWYNIFVTYDGTDTGYIYLDGTQIKNITDGIGAISSDSRDLLIGERIGATLRPANCTIDEVRIWNRSLTATEIGLYYNLTKNNYAIDLNSIRVSKHSYTGGLLNSTMDYVVT